MAAASGLAALIFGATGATGKHLLREVLSSERFTKVGEYGRSLTPEANLPAKEKLQQQKVDFDNLDAAAVKQGGWDVVFIALGTTRSKAGSAEAFEKIDREYVLNVARAAKSDDATRKQRLIYISSQSADPKAHFLYPRSKGLTEQGLATLGYDDVIIFRPGLLMDAERPENRTLEGLAEPVVRFFSRFSDSLGATVDIVAKAVRIAGELGSDSIPANMKGTESWGGGNSFAVINNSQLLKLVQQQGQ